MRFNLIRFTAPLNKIGQTIYKCDRMKDYEDAWT
jgi:hypothetical protein